jgi:hypothetical protein
MNVSSLATGWPARSWPPCCSSRWSSGWSIAATLGTQRCSTTPRRRLAGRMRRAGRRSGRPPAPRPDVSVLVSQAVEARLPGIWLRWVAPAAQWPRSRRAAMTTQNQSHPVRPRPGVEQHVHQGRERQEDDAAQGKQEGVEGGGDRATPTLRRAVRPSGTVQACWLLLAVRCGSDRVALGGRQGRASSASTSPMAIRSSGLMNSDANRNPPARAIASRTGIAQRCSSRPAVAGGISSSTSQAVSSLNTPPRWPPPLPASSAARAAVSHVSQDRTEDERLVTCAGRR